MHYLFSGALYVIFSSLFFLCVVADTQLTVSMACAQQDLDFVGAFRKYVNIDLLQTDTAPLTKVFNYNYNYETYNSQEKV